MEDASERTALLALQGATAEAILQKLVDVSLSEMPFMTFRDNVDVAGVPAFVSRSGYTGADGFEIACEWSRAPAVWQTLRDAGEDLGLTLAGLAARNVARIEAALPLYGHELSEEISPLDAGLGRFVVKDSAGKNYVGKEALLARQRLYLIGLTYKRGVPAREDGSIGVLSEGTEVGRVTSECYSPNVGSRIALALLNPLLFEREHATPFTEATLQGKDKEAPAEIRHCLF
jgi:aminomethyltransferase